MNRGSREWSGWTVRPSSGFNEAPIHESGKSVEVGCKPVDGPGFNEAPIHESGKWHYQAHHRQAAARFNEAPIHESGK